MNEEERQQLQSQIDPRFGELLMYWSIDEFHRHERGTIWYSVFLLLGLGLIVWSIIAGNYIFAVFLVLFGIFSIMQHFREPEDVAIMLFTTGLVIGDHYHEWQEIKDFSIVYEPPEVQKLYIDFVKRRHPYVSINLPDELDPNDLRELMLEFAPENLERNEEQLTDVLSRLYKL